MILTAPDAPTIPYDEIQHKLLSAIQDEDKLARAIVNAPFEYKLEMAYLFLGFITYYRVDSDAKVVRVGASSDTEHYRNSVADYPSFDESTFELSLTAVENSIAKAITTGKVRQTSDWGTLKRPGVAAKYPRANQANSGIAHTIVYPLNIPDGGALLYCYYQYKQDVGKPQKEFMKKYTEIVSSVINKRAS